MATIPMGNFGFRTPRDQGTTPMPRLDTQATDAAIRLGQQVTGMAGQQLQVLRAEEQRVADQAERDEDANKLIAARRQLNEWELAAVFDPENGSVAQKGQAAFNLPKELPSAFDRAAHGIEKELKTQRQRQAFQGIVQARREQVGAFASRHALQQREVYDRAEFESEIDKPESLRHAFRCR
ncbi:MAG: hypothetical protein EOO27_33190 [Comamonadaceae bacterium]|nr:MAG: hypothetical protein EOO27_33190 [Comamonadaceae bacterium]